MNNFADRLVDAIRTTGSSCVVGLDPRIELVPDFVVQKYCALPSEEAVRSILRAFHEIIIDEIAGRVPAIKPQIAFFEQYGLGGLQAFQDTIKYGHSRGLLVIADAKRNDIGSTAEAYARAFLGRVSFQGKSVETFNADCVTVSPILGRDSLQPFLEVAREYGKGIFVLVKTSNPGSADVQDAVLDGGGHLYERLARMVDQLGHGLVGVNGYSSVGAVVGATFPEEANTVRRLMPKAFILVPGYGAQGGTAEGAAISFNPDSLGAIVNASRSITYPHKSNSVSREQFGAMVRERLQLMIRDIQTAVDARFLQK